MAYFSMEIAITPAMPTYSGGLGVLAGDTLRAAADAGLRAVKPGGYGGPSERRFPAAPGCKRRADRGGPAIWDLESNLAPEEISRHGLH